MVSSIFASTLQACFKVAEAVELCQKSSSFKGRRKRDQSVDGMLVRPADYGLDYEKTWHSITDNRSSALIEVLDPVNLSERRVSSLGHLENIKFIVDKYIEHVQGTGAPITFIYGDQQVWETLWKLIRRSKKV